MMICLSRIIGADLALNHGAIVRSDGFVVHTYGRGYGLESTFDELFQMAVELARFVPINSDVAIDWDRTMAAWNRRSAKTGILMTVLITSFVAIVKTQNNCDVTLIAPSQIRSYLKLPLTCKKEAVHEKVQFPENINEFKIKGEKLTDKEIKQGYKTAPPAEIKGDVKDAYILARYLMRTK